MMLLTACLTEGRSPYQRLARVRPTIRMGRMGVIDLKKVTQPGFKIVGRTEVASLQQPAG
jgi:hypothetical protein